MLLKRSKQTKVSNSLKDTIYGLLVDRGIDAEVAKVMIAQMAYESNNFKSNLAQKYNNFAGITYVTRHKDKGFGKYYSVADRNNFVIFPDVESFVDDYLYVLKLPRYNNAWNDSNLLTFVQRLKQGGYFTADERTYYDGVLNQYVNLWRS
jgi:flagellum-specific peptidoglycan hydrolase FlgJ